MTCPAFITMQLLIELLPQYHPGTVYRLNTAQGGRRRLPAYDRTVGSAELWELDTILDWADRHKVDLDSAVLDRIVKEQGSDVVRASSDH